MSTRLSGRFQRTCLTLCAVCSLSGLALAQTTWHVRANALPGGDGVSWASAFNALDDGFAASQAGDTVWVTAGTYRPTVEVTAGDPRSVTFDLPDLVDVYGGFRGHETSLAQRAGLFWETVLSGDVGVLGDDSDNAYHVVRFASDFAYHASARLDGFRITGGRAGSAQMGGGVKVTSYFGINSWGVLHMANCHVIDNSAGQGGGIGVNNLSHVRLLRSTVEANFAEYDGGAVYSHSGGFWAHNSILRHNRAGERGGCLFAQSSGGDYVRFVNSLLHDNQAQRGGAAFLATGPNYFGIGKFFHCTIAFNRAEEGGAIYAGANGQFKVQSSILWGNRAGLYDQVFPVLPTDDKVIESSDIEGGYQGPGNLAADPLFVDAVARNLRTRSGSPTHDTTLESILPPDSLDLDGNGNALEPIPYDLDNGRRRADDPYAYSLPWGGNPPPDMGAYEFEPGD